MPTDPMGGALPYAGEQGGMASGAPMGGNGPDSGEFARSMLDLINEWRQVEQDDEDLLLIEKISTMVQQLLARNQKESMDAMQGKLSPRLMSQAYGG